jgi:homocysteine S-methyltransferase
MTGPAGDLAAALAAGPVLLDGGLATQLETQGADLSDELWSARLLRDDPDQISRAHRAFAAAGARVVTTATYQASATGFARRGLDTADTDRLLRRGTALARAAAPTAWVAASVGPYGAVLADGSEYRGRYGLSTAELVAFHRPRAAVLADSGADLLACETVPDLVEARALVEVLRALGAPAWLSYTIDGAHTRAGQPLTEAFAALADVPELVAVGVNCCAPQDVANAVRVAAGETGKPVVVYPNSGERWDAAGHRWLGRSGFAPELAESWVAAGARLVGGCCRVTPADVAALAGVLRGRPEPTPQP